MTGQVLFELPDLADEACTRIFQDERLPAVTASVIVRNEATVTVDGADRLVIVDGR